MWRKLVMIGVVGSFTGILVASEDPKPSGNSVASKNVDERKASNSEKQESAIREIVEAFVKTFNAHDAKGLAELYLPDAQVIDENDNTIQGRGEIEKRFATIFEESPQNKIEVQVESIRFIGTSLALETGSTTSIAAPGEIPEHARYSVLHALKDGKWSMAVVRDIPVEPTHREHLQALAWLVGDWIDESREGVVKTSCRWASDGSFLLQEIAIHQPGGERMNVSQRIGWDPLTKRFKTWMFDSEGGYGESLWTATESGWLIKATSVHADGSTASSTNRVEPNGMDRYNFRSADRIVGDQELPPVAVSVVRQAPQPK